MDEAPTIIPPWVKNSNIDSYISVIHLCAEVPHKLPIRKNAKTYLALTRYRAINHRAKPLANAKVQRLLKMGTCCEINIAKLILNTFLLYPVAC